MFLLHMYFVSMFLLLCFPESRLWSIGLGDSDMADDDDTHLDRSVDRSSVSVSLLHHLCTLAPSYREVFMDLMTMVNLIGFTPFMAAVASKVWEFVSLIYTCTCM